MVIGGRRWRGRKLHLVLSIHIHYGLAAFYGVGKGNGLLGMDGRMVHIDTPWDLAFALASHI